MNIPYRAGYKNIILVIVLGLHAVVGRGQQKNAGAVNDSTHRAVLKEVTVTANKPLVERKIDRLVFNVENSIAAKGMDLMQALALTPMLRVDDNSISIVGKSGVSVMINGRILNLGGADLANYLRSLRSDDIAKIEVITTPPARYEAQGNSGMINIVLKKNPAIGWSGNASSTYAQATYPGYANNLNLNYQSHKLSSSLKLRQYNRATHPTEKISIIGTNSLLSSDSRKDKSYGLGANLGTDYKVSDKATIGFIYDIGKSHYDIDNNSSSIYQTHNSTDSVLITLSEQRNPTFTQMLNTYYDQKLGKPGQILSSGFNYFSTTPETNIGFQTKSDQASVAFFVRNNGRASYRIWSAQSDLTLPWRGAIIETGLKFTNFDNNSDVRYYNLVQGDYKIDSSKSNLFDYNEKNLAGYISTQKDFNKKWSGKAGLRYEYAITDGYSPTNGERNKSQYGKLFPSAYITYKYNAANTISLSYSRRINRPNFRALNPFRWYINPYSYYTGNPLLQPSYNNNIELAYLYKSVFSVTLYGQQLTNGYGGIVEMINANKVVSNKNYLTKYNTGIEATLGLKIFPWWENRDFMSLNFSDARSSIPEVIPQQGFGV
ncbi:MAG TPA: outer membrane beta-barrel family protein, partial [Chitinophagaceae bacterium]|nr:outer membrane beta-barrel family protein [Chitinophagaceae bacterium]